jgi:hypothetical protein
MGNYRISCARNAAISIPFTLRIDNYLMTRFNYLLKKLLNTSGRDMLLAAQGQTIKTANKAATKK